jgi:hypothetical protein
MTIKPTDDQKSTPVPTTENTIIKIGDYVQVSGTGGAGLRLHSSAGVSYPVNYLAMGAEVFIVKDGPINADGYTWWLLQDPYTKKDVGWGVADYLSVISNP